MVNVLFWMRREKTVTAKWFWQLRDWGAEEIRVCHRWEKYASSYFTKNTSFIFLFQGEYFTECFTVPPVSSWKWVEILCIALHYRIGAISVSLPSRLKNGTSSVWWPSIAKGSLCTLTKQLVRTLKWYIQILKVPLELLWKSRYSLDYCVNEKPQSL